LVQSFDDVKFEILPQLNTVNEISLRPGDTLVVKLDQEKWDVEGAEIIYEVLAKAFPKNQILVLFDGIELEVIKNAI
jgi:hypothetical protein